MMSVIPCMSAQIPANTSIQKAYTLPRMSATSWMS